MLSKLWDIFFGQDGLEDMNTDLACSLSRQHLSIWTVSNRDFTFICQRLNLLSVVLVVLRLTVLNSHASLACGAF